MFGGSSSLYSGDCIAATTIITFGELNLCPHRIWMIGGGYLGLHETSLSAGSDTVSIHLFAKQNIN